MPVRRRQLVRRAGIAALSGAVLLAAIGAFLLVVAGPGAVAPAVAQAKNEIDGTAALKWEPANLNIKPGDTVTFKISGGPPHPVASGDGSNPQGDDKFDSSKCQLAQMSKVGDSCEVKFAKAGTFPYFCEIHVAVGMKGVITVGSGGGGASAPSTTGTPTPAASPDTPAAATSPPGKPGIYYAGWGLLALGGLLALAAIAGYLRYAPDFNRQRK
jgi:plastocyanin